MFLHPKKLYAIKVGDYRPTSLIHSIAKIFSKLLANRLAPYLNTLVSKFQRTVIKRWCIEDNFLPEHGEDIPQNEDVNPIRQAQYTKSIWSWKHWASGRGGENGFPFSLALLLWGPFLTGSKVIFSGGAAGWPLISYATHSCHWPTPKNAWIGDPTWQSHTATTSNNKVVYLSLCWRWAIFVNPNREEWEAMKEIL